MATLVAFSGFEYGRVENIGAGTAGNQVFDGSTGTLGTDVQIVSGTPTGGVGSYVLQVGLQAKNLFWNTSTLGSSKTDLVVSMRFRLTSLPTGDTDIISMDRANSTDAAGFFYQSSTGKLVAWIGGSSQASTNTISVNTWYTLQWKYNCLNSSNTLDWIFNGVTGTQVTGGSASTIARLAIGNRSSGTGTAQYDDVSVSVTGADHPLTVHQVRMLVPDTGGTTTEIGTANSTARFTTNNTIDSTHNSANILTAISEVPPTIGTSASGVAQRAGGSSDAISIPMTSYTLASGETLAGCRIIVCGWANGTLSSNLGLRAYNGSAETTLIAGTVADNFSNSTTSPDWMCKSYTDVTDQTTLNALEVRLGYSTDISPEPGAHAVYAEIAVVPSSGVTLTASGIGSSEQLGAPSISFVVSAPGAPTAEQLGAANVALSISTPGIGSSERLGSPGINLTVNPAGISSTEQFGAPSVNMTVNPAGIVSGAQSGTANTSFAIAAGNIGSSELVGAPAINLTVTPVAVGSAETLGNATVSSSATISASGIQSSELFGTTNAAFAISASGVVSGELLGTPTLSTTYTINANGIVSAEGVGTANATLGAAIVNPSGIATGEVLGSPAITTSTQISPSGIVSSESIGNSTLSTTYTINANGVISAERNGAAAVEFSVTPASIFSTEQLGLPSFTLTMNAAGIPSDAQVGSATVTPGAITVNPSGIISAEASGSSTIILAQSIAAAGIVTLEQLGTPTISVGAVTLNPGSIVSGESIGNAQLSISVTSSGIPSGVGMGSPSITIGPAGISAGSIDSTEQLGNPTISTNITTNLNGISSAAQLGAAFVYREVSAGGVGSGEIIGSPTITVGPVTITAGGIPESSALGTTLIDILPLVAPKPNTLIRVRISQSTVRINASETLLSL